LRPETRVVDWYTHGDDPGIIVGDGVHLTDAGERLFAASMAASVEAMYGG
jgi:lysophospholipase L1-like esterase